MEFSEFEEKTIKRQTLYSGQIIEVAIDEVVLPSGQLAKRELVFHSGAVGILAVTGENKIVLVKQFRKPLEKVILEIPAGKIDLTDQTTRETAERELEEETSYQAEKWTLIQEFASAPGFSNEVIYLYQASDLRKVTNPLPQDEDELIELHELTLEEAQASIRSGDIYDAKTILAIHYWEIGQLRKSN